MRQTVILAFSFFAILTPLYAAPKLLASIRPVHSWLSYLAQGVTEPELLLQTRHSPHLYQLKPSDVKRLQDADAVFWIGPTLESNLQKPLRSITGTAIVTLLENNALQTLPSRASGLHQNLHPTHTGYESDSHIWLSIDNTLLLSKQMAAFLQTIDPANAAIYQRNSADLETELLALKHHLRISLQAIEHTPFIVAHDAFQYLEHDYQLNALGSLFIHSERKPGAQRMLELHKYIRSQNACCILTDTKADDPLVNTLIENSSIRVCPLDPLGLTLEPGKKLYFDLMQQLGRDLMRCLDT